MARPLPLNKDLIVCVPSNYSNTSRGKFSRIFVLTYSDGNRIELMAWRSENQVWKLIFRPLIHHQMKNCM